MCTCVVLNGVHVLTWPATADVSAVEFAVDDVRDVVAEEGVLLLSVVDAVLDVIEMNPDVVQLVFGQR